MEIVSQIKEWTEAFLPQELFLVDIETKIGSSKISIFIDGDQGVDIPACQKLSRHLSDKLDEQNYGEEPYYLEVSSPGADSPLLKFRQYPKHIGRELFVKLKAETELTGKLISVTEDTITIALKDKKKGYLNAPEKSIPFADVAEASVILSFK
jgi:ribosome maturation factor RimP